MYLAQRGYKTGNVPLVPGLEPGAQDFRQPRLGLIGLVVLILVLLVGILAGLGLLLNFLTSL